MKIGISLTQSHLGNKKYKALKECGFDTLDLNLANTDTAPYTLDEKGFHEYLDEQKLEAEKAGIIIHQIHGPWCWPIREVTPEGMAERLSSMKRCILAAAYLGAKYMVIHPIMPNGIEERNDKKKSADTIEKNLCFMSELAEYAKEAGVVVCLENMPFTNFTISTPEEIANIVYTISSDNFKMCLDTGHSVIFEGWQPAVALEKYSDIIKTLHVHDNHGQADEHLVPLEDGIIDWKAFSDSLKRVGFDGSFSFECAPRNQLPDHIFIDFLSSFGKLGKHLTNM